MDDISNVHIIETEINMLEHLHTNTDSEKNLHKEQK